MLVSELTGEDWRGCGEQLALLSFVAVGPGVPRALGPAAWLHVVANNNGNNSAGREQMRLSVLQITVMNYLFINAQIWQNFLSFSFFSGMSCSLHIPRTLT